MMMLMTMEIVNATREYVTTFAFILRVVSATIHTDLVSFSQPIDFRNVFVGDRHGLQFVCFLYNPLSI